MFRTIATTLLLLGPSSLWAQFPLGGYGPNSGQMSATVMRQSAFPYSAPTFGAQTPLTPHLSTFGYYGGFYPAYAPFGYGYGYGGYGFGYNPPQIQVNYTVEPPEPTGPARNFAVPAPLGNDPTVAKLTLQAPTGAEVWLNDKKVEMNGTKSFVSPALKPDDTYTFAVRVTWMENGKSVEEKRTLVVKAGEFQQLQYLALPPETTKLEK